MPLRKRVITPLTPRFRSRLVGLSRFNGIVSGLGRLLGFRFLRFFRCILGLSIFDIGLIRLGIAVFSLVVLIAVFLLQIRGVLRLVRIDAELLEHVGVVGDVFEIVVNHHVVAVFVNLLVGILILKTVQQVIKLLGFLAAAGLFKEVLLGLHGTHTVLTRKTLRAADGMNHFNGLVPHLQIAKGTGIHQEHLDLGSAMQLLALIGQRQFHGLLRFTDTTLAVSDERQVVEEAVHTVGGTELTQGQLVVALTVGHERERLAGKVDAGGLTGHPLGVFQGKFGIALLQRESGEDVQTNVLRMLLGQAAQTFALILGQHRPFHALGHLGLVGTTVGVRVLRGEAHRAVGVTARTPHVFRALLLTVLALLFLRKLAEFAVTTVVVAAVVPAEVATLTITMEITAIVIPSVIAAEVTTIVVTVLVARVLAVLAFVGTVAAFAARLETFTVTARTTAAVTTLVEATGLAVRLTVAAVALAITITARRVTLTILTAARLEALAIAVAARTEAVAIEARTVAAIAALATETRAAALVEVATLAVRLAVAAVALTVTITARRVAFAILTTARLETFTVMTRLETALAARLETLATAVARSAIAIPLMAAAVGLAGTLVTFCHYLFSLIRC